MNLFNRTSIKARILIIPAIGLLAFLLSLSYTYYVNNGNALRLTKVEQVYFPILERASTNIEHLHKINELLKNAAADGEIEGEQLASYQKNQILKNLAEIETMDPDQTEQLNKIKQSLEKYYILSSQLTIGIIDGTADFSNMAKQVQEMNLARNNTEEMFEEFKSSSLEHFSGAINTTRTESTRALQTSLWIVTVLALVLGVASLSIASSITRNINHVINSLKDIASGEGDLSKRIKVESHDEIGELVQWFNKFVEKLHGIISEVVDVVKPLSATSDELTCLGNDATDVAFDQSQSTQQVSESIDQMITSISEVATNASAAAAETLSAQSEAENAKEVISKTIHGINSFAKETEQAAATIRELHTAAEAVGSIIEVIQSIAEQTNLLALNAAIEAARAGDQGRGFAVVADEVRTLAARTHSSTQEIQEVIERLQRIAEAGSSAMEKSEESAKSSVAQSSQTNESLEAILSRITTTSEMNNKIATATKTQKATSDNIQANVQGIVKSSEKSAQSAEKVTNAIKSLQQVSDTLNSVAKQFVL